jgi:hypothetical protein
MGVPHADAGSDAGAPVPWRDQKCNGCRKRLSAPVLKEGGAWVHMRCYQGRPDLGAPDRPAYWAGGQ